MLHQNELEIARNAPAPGCSVETAQQYTRWLATHHYENFHVVSWLLPRHLHQHFYNVYAYCRWADDLGDEIADPRRAMELLDWWELELQKCYEGRPSQAVYVALRETIVAKDIPRQPFADLLRAFRQDQTVKRYQTWESVLDYCVYSANPVGRLVLYLCGYRDERRQRLSDATCTALQLANFWQDVSRDLEKGRVYIPLDAAAHHGVTEEEIVSRRFGRNYVALMKDLIARTRILFNEGLPLARQVEGKLSVDLEMFSRGGMAVLDAIESQGYNTLHHRPSISRVKQATLLMSTLIRQALPGKSAGGRRAHPLTENLPSKTCKISPADIDGAARLDIAQSYAACWNLAREAHSNFYYAFFLLPKAKRDGMAALYAFMRLVDNVADGGEDIAAKQRGLAKWRAALDEAIGGYGAFVDGSSALELQSAPTGASQVLPALADTVRRFHMPARYLHDQISGAEMDLTVHSYPTFDRLREYCYRVAGTVGLTCTHIFGFDDPRAPDLAEKLGLAFQLTNIIRDVHEDAGRGRVYLPDEDLARFNVSREDLAKNEGKLGVRELLRLEADRAYELYEEGAELLELVDADSRGTLWLLIHTYNALLGRIESLDFAVFGERIRLSKAEKMLFIARARFGRHTRENVLEKRDRDWRRAGRDGGRRRAG